MVKMAEGQRGFLFAKRVQIIIDIHGRPLYWLPTDYPEQNLWDRYLGNNIELLIYY